MKNIEKLAVDSLVKSLDSLNDDIVRMGEFKVQFEEAKKNFQGSAAKLVSSAKSVVNDISDELSEEAIAYLEAEMSKRLTVPFKLK